MEEWCQQDCWIIVSRACPLIVTSIWKTIHAWINFMRAMVASLEIAPPGWSTKFKKGALQMVGRAFSYYPCHSSPKLTQWCFEVITLHMGVKWVPYFTLDLSTMPTSMNVSTILFSIDPGSRLASTGPSSRPAFIPSHSLKAQVPGLLLKIQTLCSTQCQARLVTTGSRPATIALVSSMQL